MSNAMKTSLIALFSSAVILVFMAFVQAGCKAADTAPIASDVATIVGCVFTDEAKGMAIGDIAMDCLKDAGPQAIDIVARIIADADRRAATRGALICQDAGTK